MSAIGSWTELEMLNAKCCTEKRGKRRKTAKRVVVMCRNCGSMLIRLARDLRHGKDTFCDVECANEYKAIAYQDAAYKERYRKGCEAATSGYAHCRLLAAERKAMSG